VEVHTTFPIKGPQGAAAALKPLAVDGVTINRPALSWAVNGAGQEERSHARKLRVSVKPEIKIGVLLRRSPAGRFGLITPVGVVVVPIGMPLSGPDTSGDVRLSAVSGETAGLDKSKPLAWG
jgi:hypothetical protein